MILYANQCTNCNIYLYSLTCSDESHYADGAAYPRVYGRSQFTRLRFVITITRELIND